MSCTRLLAAVGGLAIMLLVFGCRTAPSPQHGTDHHVLKEGRPYDHVIANPYEWALQQFSEGPISGVDVDNYTRLVLRYGLEEAHADLGSDGTRELLLRQAIPYRCRVWTVLVFTPVNGGYRYLGDFGAGPVIVLDTPEPSILSYWGLGAHSGVILTYRHDGTKFVSIDRRSIESGPGAPEENNKELEKFFSEDKVVKWVNRHSTADPVIGGHP